MDGRQYGLWPSYRYSVTQDDDNRQTYPETIKAVHTGNCGAVKGGLYNSLWVDPLLSLPRKSL